MDIKIEHRKGDYVYRKYKYTKPTDGSSDWISTGEYITDSSKPIEEDSCKCSIKYRYADNQENICNGNTLYSTVKLQYNDGCGDVWNDYVPKIVKLDKVIETDSTECGNNEYEERWSGTLSGQYVIDNYYNAAKINEIDASKNYQLLLQYYKINNETEWTEFLCHSFLDYKIIN